MPEIEIRPAVPGDLATLANIDHTYQTAYVWQMDRALEKGQVNIHFRQVRLPRPIRVEAPVSPEVTGPDSCIRAGLLVALHGGLQVGYISLKEIQPSSTAWVLDLVVRDSERRHGIGTALLMAGDEWASKHSLRRIVLEIQSKNFPAHQMALKLGYELCGYNDQYFSNRDIALFFAKYLR